MDPIATFTEPLPNISQFNQTLLYLIDQLLPGTSVKDVANIDGNYAFLRDVMKFDHKQIQNFRNVAEAFFRDFYGLDFTQAKPDSQNVKAITGAMLLPYRFNPLIRYRAFIFDPAGGAPRLGMNRDGGFLVMITGPGVTYGGTYGGQAGKPATPGDSMAIGFYNIGLLNKNGEIDEEVEPIIVNYKASSPVHPPVDGVVTIHCQNLHPAWGIGVGRGYQIMEPADSENLRFMQRGVVTFGPGVAP